MKVTSTLLKQYLDFDRSPGKLADRIIKPGIQRGGKGVQSRRV